jgi:hypothetical protein
LSTEEILKANLPAEKAPAVVLLPTTTPFAKKRLIQPQVTLPTQKNPKKNKTQHPKKLGTIAQVSTSGKPQLPMRGRQNQRRHTGTVDPLSLSKKTQSVNECVVCEINHDMPSEWKTWDPSYWTKSYQVSSAPRGVKSCHCSNALTLCFNLPGKTCRYSKNVQGRVWPSHDIGQERFQP